MLRDVLRRHRLRAGLTQEELAERAGLSPRGVSDLERGARTLARRDTLRRLAKALELGAEERAALLSAAQQARATARPGVPEARSALPLPLTSFIGREADLEQVSRLVKTERLVTLTGPGGVGKTRLALEVASRVESGEAPEVVWVDLTTTRDPRLVLTLVAEALDVRDLGGRGLHQALSNALSHREVLLLLDNVEHVLDAASEVAALLRACPGLRILATSREPLRVQGEHVFSVAPLAVPNEAELPDAVQVARAPAVALFVERAQAANPSFRLDGASTRTVVELCRRLDGLPLAIELAAARSRALGPDILVERDGRLDLLRGLRDQPDRHASLRTVLDWSFHRLSDPEQVLLRRLSVFAGGWTLEAAEAVCGEGQAPQSVLDLLGRLVDRSLVVVEPAPLGGRFRLLETLREYAAERLAASGERHALERRHALYFLGLAEQAAPHFWGPQTAAWLERLDRDHDNLRAALGWSVGPADQGDYLPEEPPPAEVGLRLGVALQLFWDLRGQLEEGRTWLDRVLAQPAAVAVRQSFRISAFFAAGYVAFTQGDYLQGRARFRATIELAQRTGQARMQAQGLLGLGVIGVLEGRDLDQAQGVLQAAHRLGLESGNALAHASSLYWLGEIALARGDRDAAQALLLECLPLTRRTENLWGAAYVLASLGRIALAQTRLDAARDYQQESLALRRDLDDRRGIALCLEELAWVAGLNGQAQHAARLFGASAALHEELGLPLVPVPEWRTWHERAEQAARERLGDESYAGAWAAGRTLSRDEAILLALTSSSGRAVRVPP